MQQRIWQVMVAGVLLVGTTSCSSLGPGKKAETKEAPAQQVSLSDVPAPARAAIEKVTAGGKIRQLEKAEEGGKTIYDVEATVGGREVEYDITADGTILTAGQSVPYASVPLVVRHAAEKYFGSA